MKVDKQEKIINQNSINFRAKNVSININQNNSLISIKWDPDTSNLDFRSGYQLATDLAKRFCIKRWLHDARNVAYLNIENQNWILREIVPQLVNAKVSKLARVIIDEPLAMLVAGSLLDKVNNYPAIAAKLKCEIFTDYEDALYWLKR